MSIAIMVIISGVVLYNFPRFNRTIALERAAREVATVLRTAQARAVQVRATNGGEFPKNYGVHFDLANPDKLVLFTDSAACLDKDYTSSCSEEVTAYRLGNGVLINKLEGPPAALCPKITGTNEYSSFNVLFYRPDPSMEATCGPGALNEITTSTVNGPFGPYKIYVKSPESSIPEKVIQVWLTGQISVKR